MKNTCCVPHCESRRSSVKLHRFPKTEIGLKWVKILNCARLQNLSSEELQKFFVCHKHFEERFVTDRFRLRMIAYPTLFSNEEIDIGIPAPAHEDSENENVLCDHDYTQSRKRRHEDHSYYKCQSLKEIVRNESQDDSVPSTSKLFKTSCQKEVIQKNFIQDIADNMSSAPSEITTDCKAKQQLMPDSPQCNFLATPKKTTRRRFVIKKKNFTPRCQRILKEYKNAKKQLSFAIRCKRTMKFSKKEIV